MSEIKVRVNSFGRGRAFMLVYTDPVSGKKVARSSGTTNRGKAERAAAVWEDELNSGRYKPPSKITWAEFRQKYEAEKLANAPETSQSCIASAFNHVERILNPDRLAKLNTAAISKLVAEMRKPREFARLKGDTVVTVSKPPVKESTIASHLRQLKAALRWANKQGILREVPAFPSLDAGEAKGRPITGEEFDRMLAAVPLVRPRDPEVWTRFLTGLWLSGLRLREALRLSWDADAPFAVDLRGKRPVYRIEARAQKSRRSETVPVTPDMAEFLLQTPEEDRHGPVFAFPSLKDGTRMTHGRVGRIVSRIGERAGVVVNKDAGKCATAHDLRRAFGTRWAKRVMPAVLKRLMRHASIDTTMTYYVALDADELADQLWTSFGSNSNNSGNTLTPRGGADGGIEADTMAGELPEELTGHEFTTYPEKPR